jgi:hypothetical protein
MLVIMTVTGLQHEIWERANQRYDFSIEINEEYVTWANRKSALDSVNTIFMNLLTILCWYMSLLLHFPCDEKQASAEKAI